MCIQYMIKNLLSAGLIVGVLLAGAANAQLEREVARYLASPEAVVRFAVEANLDDGQKSDIQSAIRAARDVITQHELSLLEHRQAIVRAISTPDLDGTAALTNLDLLLEKEAKIKREHLKLWLKVNSMLTPEQRETLVNMQRKSRKFGAFMSPEKRRQMAKMRSHGHRNM